MSATECRPGTDAESAGAPGKPVPRSTRRSKARSDAVAAEVRLTVALAGRTSAWHSAFGAGATGLTQAEGLCHQGIRVCSNAATYPTKTRSVARSCFDTDTCAH